MQKLDEQRAVRTSRALVTSALLLVPLLLSGCDTRSPSGEAINQQSRADGNHGNSSEREQPKKMTEQMRLGRSFFSACAVCHQYDGRGIAGLFPTLDGSPVVNGRADNLVRIVLSGLHKPAEVPGRMVIGQMPAWSQFDDRTLAAVLSYVRGSWSNHSPPVSEELVAAVREATRERKAAWTMAELESTEPIEVKP